MYIFLLTFLIYFQNLIFSLFFNFPFIPTIFEFILVFIISYLIIKSKYPKTFFSLWQLLYLIHFSFISFFGTTINSTDIYLFFTHIQETFETAVFSLELFTKPFVITFLTLIFILATLKKQKTATSFKRVFILSIGIIIFWPIKYNDASFILIKELIKIPINYQPSTTDHQSTQISHQPSTINPNINILFVIGESMRAKEYLTNSFSIFNDYSYKSIYSAATNTDVSVPLLLNGATDPTQINLSNNLFVLARQNGFTTSFITTQSSKSLKYIKSYLQNKEIEYFKIIGSRDDMDLLKELKKTNLEKNNFIVLQMQGEHSPYSYYPKEFNRYKDKTIENRYNNSMLYSDYILTNMIKYLQANSKKPTLFIFTSDHGEFIGLKGRYGHNKFEPEIYKVPFVSYSKDCKSFNPQNIKSHFHIYQLLKYFLGYGKELNFSQETIRINGTMITGEDGFIKVVS